LKKVYVLTGAVLLIIGLLLAIAWMPSSREFLPQKEKTLYAGEDQKEKTLYAGEDLKVAGEDITATVKYESKQDGGQVVALVFSEEQYKQLGEALETKKTEETMRVLEILFSDKGQVGRDYTAKSSGEKGELKWTSTEDATYVLRLYPPYSLDYRELKGLKIQKDPGFTWEEYKMQKGSTIVTSFVCVNAARDRLQAVITDQYGADMFQQGKGVPRDRVLVSAEGTEGVLTFLAPESGTYYLIMFPTAGYWPILYDFEDIVLSLPEGTELPMTIAYSVEASDPGGPWYVGVIVTIVGVALIVVGFRKPPVQAAPPTAPAYAPPTPTVQAPTKFCIHCGAPNPADSKFCKTCGQKQA